MTGGSLDNYNVTIVPATIKINKINLTITLADYEKTYDGSSVTTANITNADGKTYNVEGLIEGQTVTIPSIGSIVSTYKEVGVYVYTVPLESINVTNGSIDNYNVVVIPAIVNIKAKGTIYFHIDNIYAFTSDTFDPASFVGEGLIIIDSFNQVNSGHKIVVDTAQLELKADASGENYSIVLVEGTGIKVVDKDNVDVTEEYDIQCTGNGRVIYLVTN